MDKNIKIAKELVGIEKMLVSEDTSFSSSSSNTRDDIESMSKNEKLNLAKTRTHLLKSLRNCQMMDVGK